MANHSIINKVQSSSLIKSTLKNESICKHCQKCNNYLNQVNNSKIIPICHELKNSSESTKPKSKCGKKLTSTDKWQDHAYSTNVETFVI